LALLEKTVMCQIFINADPALYATRSRSLRVHGVSTSIRLENMFWSVLEEIGRRDGMTVNQLIARLYDELIEAGVDGANFTSFLRVCCTRYLSLQLAGRIPADLSVPIGSLDPAWVLAGERRTEPAPAGA
jgi:predicted DNA-binding ribbon-helix-helix protein